MVFIQILQMAVRQLKQLSLIIPRKACGVLFIVRWQIHHSSQIKGGICKNLLFAKVSGIDDYINQTFGTTIHAIEKAARAALVIALLLCVLVTLLFMNMLITKDQAPIAIIKALGFTNVDIATQYAARSVLFYC